MAKNHDVNVSLVREIHKDLELEITDGFEVNHQATGGVKETVIRESLGSEVNLDIKNLEPDQGEAAFNQGSLRL